VNKTKLGAVKNETGSFKDKGIRFLQLNLRSGHLLGFEEKAQNL